jgi:4-amino-4-deoxy-L-arabinose transferase-like glycosyltransferase
MNGAFVYDMVRSGHIIHPITYAKEYYGHLPALTMPYHPPMFPVIESLFFALLGVKLLTARLVVAVAVGICAFLMYRLVQSTLQNHVLAACATVTTLSLWNVQLAARDVMLEFPALALVLAALYSLRDIDRDFSLGGALLFAAFAAAAVWTKQLAAFVGAVPVIYALFTRRWRLLLRKEVWVSLLILAGAVLGLMFLSMHVLRRGDVNQIGSTARDFRLIFLQNVRIYSQWIVANLRGLPGVFAASAIASYAWAVHKRGWQKLGLSLYVAWIVSVILILLVLGAVEPRYLFCLFPAVIVIGYALLFRGCSSLWGERRAWYLPVGFATAWLALGLVYQPRFVRGPRDAAALIVRGAPTRVLYAGEAGGNFIFAVRSLDPKLQVTVVLGAKFSPEMFEPVTFEQFCRKFGINWVVFEDTPEGGIWSRLRNSPAASMKFERSIPLESYRPASNGKIYLYRFTAPAGASGGVLEIPVRKLGGAVKVKL